MPVEAAGMALITALTTVAIQAACPAYCAGQIEPFFVCGVLRPAGAPGTHVRQSYVQACFGQSVNPSR